jgi:hypothetical protein
MGSRAQLTTRVLIGRGWTASAMATPGWLGAFIAVPASQCIYRVVTPGQAIDRDETELVRPLTAAPDEAARVGLLASALPAQMT